MVFRFTYDGKIHASNGSDMHFMNTMYEFYLHVRALQDREKYNIYTIIHTLSAAFGGVLT